jgi:hypothetical protein
MSDTDPARESQPADADQESVENTTEADSDSGGPDRVDESEYALGETSDPDGASREEPAGEDYAGSGF